MKAGPTDDATCTFVLRMFERLLSVSASSKDCSFLDSEEIIRSH